MTHHVRIDYDENSPETSYAGVVVKCPDDTEKRWMTGNPQADWAAYIDWALQARTVILESSSVTHFLHDTRIWRMIEDARGIEMIVPEDRPGHLDPD